MDLSALLAHAHTRLDEWEASFGPFERHPSLQVDEAAMQTALERYLLRLRGNYPFFHPRYAGQMLKPPHPAALVAAVAAMRINPNNHALDGGPPTSAMEKELVPRLAVAMGLPGTSLGHLTAGGTIANLEALFIAREEHPGTAIAVSEAAHYTHTRMAHVLGVEAVSVPADALGRLDLDALETVLRTGRIGTVVVTAGTTGLGAVDPIADVIPLARQYGVRVHVDAAYGGFFCLLAHAEESPLAPETARHLRAVGEADSVVVDPHKHGLQPYGCGAVLFRDPGVGRHYVHDSPYTYFTSDDLHLGEISLECSRAGAAAGALWLTLELLPLEADRGLGPGLAAGLRAARTWAQAVEASRNLRLLQAPELDIVAYFPHARAASEVDRHSQRLFDRAMHDAEDPIFTALYVAAAERLHGTTADVPRARILRSVLMKPEHEHWAERLVGRLDDLAGRDQET
ncbi:MAG TPA: aminotransferase class V-fold PLP-dependent enzyme [Rhodothermales bacterium]|nr:aminotransferase class V-fold PLP-dependent enzyme [Rhodothermales bacterium]